MKTYTLESSKITDMETFFMTEFLKYLDFGAFWSNFDALFDCLSEYDGDTLVLSGFDGFEEKLGDDMSTLMEIFPMQDLK